MKVQKLLLACLLLINHLGFSQSAREATDKPNIVYIFLDDAGVNDYGSYGNSKISTPNIDRLAKEGILFNQHYSAASNCSPSRSALLTGRYQVRHGLNEVLHPTSTTGIDPNEITIAEALKGQGYGTGIIGKWHLGSVKQHLPLQHGFDYYFGIPYSNDMTPVFYFRNNDTVKISWIKGSSPELIRKKLLITYKRIRISPSFCICHIHFHIFHFLHPLILPRILKKEFMPM